MQAGLRLKAAFYCRVDALNTSLDAGYVLDILPVYASAWSPLPWRYGGDMVQTTAIHYHQPSVQYVRLI